MIPKILQDERLKFCRIKRGTKKPFEKDWTNKPYTYKEISKFKNENYGVLCGYGDLAVIDSDKKELQLAIEQLFPITYRVKTGGGGTHNYFLIPELKQKIILETETGEHLGEVQSHGTQVVGPNSIHPNEKKYEVSLDVPIATLTQEKLIDILKPFMREFKETEETAKYENQIHSEINNLLVADIWGLSGLKKQGQEYYGSHPIHDSEGGMNFWINPLKNLWHCFRCNSGGGALSAIAVKEKIIDCSEAQKGILRGQRARQALKLAEEKYGLIKDTKTKEIEQPGEEIEILWDDDLDTFQEEEQEWIVDKLIPSRSVCILSGKRGTLKTFITLLLAYSISSGNDFLGKFQVKQGTVIYLDKENGVHIMKKRKGMIKSGLDINEKQKVGFICFSQLKIDKHSDIAQITKSIEKYKPLVLVIDTYRRGISFDENDAGAVSELFVDTLRPLVEKNNLSILLIHHDRKGSGGEVPDEMDEIRGSSDLANYADIILKMERKAGNVILKQLKNRNAQEINPIRIKVDFDVMEQYVKMSYEGEYLKQSKADRCVELLVNWIAKEGIKQFQTKEAKEIGMKGGYKDSTIKNSLLEMQDTGFISSVGFGMYKIEE